MFERRYGARVCRIGIQRRGAALESKPVQARKPRGFRRSDPRRAGPTQVQRNVEDLVIGRNGLGICERETGILPLPRTDHSCGADQSVSPRNCRTRTTSYGGIDCLLPADWLLCANRRGPYGKSDQDQVKGAKVLREGQILLRIRNARGAEMRHGWGKAYSSASLPPARKNVRPGGDWIAPDDLLGRLLFLRFLLGLGLLGLRRLVMRLAYDAAIDRVDVHFLDAGLARNGDVV